MNNHHALLCLNAKLNFGFAIYDQSLKETKIHPGRAMSYHYKQSTVSKV